MAILSKNRKMILANDNSWVMCTPTKVGSTSLEATLINRLKIAHNIFQESPYQHGPKYQHGAMYHGKAERILIVRHPLERWSSIYWFMVKRNIFLKKYAHDINLWTEEWLKSREVDKHRMWNMSLVDYHKIFKPKKIFKQENGFNDLLEYIGQEIQMSNSNINPLNFGWDNTKKLLTASNYKKIEDLFKPDIKILKY